MKSRRKFLLETALATTAVITAKPFNLFANALAPVTGNAINSNRVFLLHSGEINSQSLQQINKIRQNTYNLLHVHTGSNTVFTKKQLKYDVCANEADKITGLENNYQITYKGNVKIGIVNAAEMKDGTISQVNSISKFLKNEMDCDMVVCLSLLGFKNKLGQDDLTLASQSEYLDIIIGSHPDNFCKGPYIVHNINKAEVIIHAVGATENALGNIEIGFDNNNSRNFIAFNNMKKSASAIC